MKSGFYVVFCTAPGSETAESMADALVEAGLAACVNLIPRLRSIYRWKGELCREEEVLMIIKTRADRFPDLESMIKRLHPYEVPEIIAIPIADGAEEYLSWLNQQVE